MKGASIYDQPGLCPHHWPELIPVNNDPPLIAVLFDLTRDHFHRITNFEIQPIQVSLLRRHESKALS